MLPLIAAGTLIYVISWVSAVLCAHFEHWIVAAVMVSVAALGWALSITGVVLLVLRVSKRDRALVVGGAAAIVAMYSAALWFVALYATLQAQDPGAFVSSLPVGFTRVWFAGIDNAVGTGIGTTLPASNVAGWAMSIQQILFWPSVITTAIAFLLMNRVKK